MDQRKLKTRQAIQDAFMKLRKEKSLEQISVTELSRLARISKATFYLHYRDIFDLSEQLQNATIKQALDQMDISPSIMDRWPDFAREMTTVMDRCSDALTILFSGSQMAMIPVLLENHIRERIWEHTPDLKENTELSIRLTYHIQGSYHTYLRHAHHADMRCILDIIHDIHSKTGMNTDTLF